jgi:two-component system NtrC family sensor kinase
MMNFLLIILLIIVCLIFIVLFLKTKKNEQYFKRALEMKKQRHDTTIQNKISLSKKQLETAFDAITDCICALDKNLVITRVNKSYSRFVQIPIPELLGKHCYEVFWKRTAPCEHCPALATFCNSQTVLKQSYKMPGQDRTRYFTIATYPVLDTDGSVINVIEYTRDSTEEKAIMEQLIRSEKLASIGTMTAGIAHELINPLSSISGTASNMLSMPEKYGINGKGNSRMVTILEAVSRASLIIKDLLHLSKKEDGTSVLTDINSVVLKAVEVVKLKGLPLVDYKIHTQDTLSLVLCDPAKIEQVIINLVTNAIYSIIEKKAVMAREKKDFTGLILIATHTDTLHACIDVTDNGHGVPEEIKNRIFDPFFTTRPPGEGTGLGLSLCQKIIQEHHGRITFESNLSTTTFSIRIPANTTLIDREN